jgi:DNA integrity scanning protein DisA with diadenylate cyclase activity
VSGTDHRPTDQHLEVFEQYRSQLDDYWSTMRRLEAEDLATLNAELRGRGVGPVAPK